MRSQINISNFTINGITQNANADIGQNLQNSHTANSKNYGVNFTLGDYSPSTSIIFSVNFDNDKSDQGQTDNPSSPSEE
ncbi:spore germination protein [Bacillus tequilensis]|uniref:Spore germination protein n=1 Tax=Bacillus tequilensis TaxID=227866 RepID=A0A6H0WHX4_9BACI|nr:spore germination protein [Bacillus tequilensis]QIW78863.1 spore germination protein [Bacillus tequilensis]